MFHNLSHFRLSTWEKSVHWVCKEHKWNGLLEAKEYPSSRSTPSPCTSSPRLHQLLHSSEENITSSKSSLQQYKIIAFSTQRANPIYMNGIVFNKTVSCAGTRRPFPCCRRKLFRVGICQRPQLCSQCSYLFFISTRYVTMAFITASLPNILLLICLFSDFYWFKSFCRRSRSIFTLSSVAKKLHRSFTPTKKYP